MMIYSFRRIDSNNKPTTMLSLEKIKQTASATWCLVRVLPFLIGHLIPEGNTYWEMYLSLRAVMDMVFAPVTTIGGTFSMEAVIQSHHELYLRVSY